MDVLSHFGQLDELIQLIYQGLKGSEGRWWRGSWSASDITHFLGSKPSSKVLEGFAHNLSEAFVNGELCIGDWVSDPGAKINVNSLTLRTTSKKPVRVPLVEISATEAASYATTVFSGVWHTNYLLVNSGDDRPKIALQAQARKCQLNPPAFSAQTVATAGPSHTKSDVHPKKAHAVESVTRPTGGETEAQQKIEALEAELEHVKAAKIAKSKSPLSEPEPKSSVPARRPKGASLANPHKKARKYEAVEFESDGDEATGDR